MRETRGEEAIGQFGEERSESFGEARARSTQRLERQRIFTGGL